MIKRSAIDRRSGTDRRQEYSIAIFDHNRNEDRSYIERRQTSENRKEWTRTTQWSSVHVPIPSGL